MLHTYFQYFSSIMAAESEAVRAFYKQHPGKLGEANEAVLQRFLSSCLPQKFSIGSGFALFQDSSISTEQDIIIYDAYNYPVFFPGNRSAIFPPNAVHAMIEVKTTLTTAELKKTVYKTAVVKQQIRSAYPPELLQQSQIYEPLVCAFAYSGPDISSIKETLISLQKDIDDRDRLDFLCVLNEGLITSGTYFNIAHFGEPTSHYAQGMTTEKRTELLMRYPERVQCWRLRENSLFVFYYYLLSYIIRRPVFWPDLIRYAPTDYIWGEEC